MREELEAKQRSVRTILVSCERLPGYVTLKLKRVMPQLQRAIQKLTEATYGFCDDCDDTIPDKRLKAVPGATRCVTCQTLSERRKH